MLLKNKKADEKLLSPWMFLIWIIVILGVSIGASMFYGTRFDIKATESKILNTRMLDCLVVDSNLNGDLFNKDFNLFSSCNFQEKILIDSGLYFLKINVSKVGDSNSLYFNKMGNFDLEIQAQISAKSSSFANCFSDSFKTLYQKEEVILDLLTCSNNEGSKI